MFAWKKGIGVDFKGFPNPSEYFIWGFDYFQWDRDGTWMREKEFHGKEE